MDKKRQAYKKGLWAEALASLLLMLKGYKILARRYKSPVGEIDLIARRGRTLLIVEVKSRSDELSALESVSKRAQARISGAARHFISGRPEYADYAVRFDVIAFIPPFRLRHLDNAWVEHT